MKEIIINKKAENRHGEYELREDQLKKSFENEYNQISKIFKEVYNNQIAFQEKKRDSDDEKKIESLNNIIGIIGERGAGKSSFMRSVSKIKSKKYKILYLEPIDPSKFTNSCNILEIILGNMFKNFKKELEEKSNENKYSDKRELLESFQNIYKSIKYLKNKNCDLSSEIDELLTISEAFNLKENLEKLIKDYLRFFNEECLLICIDDIDLSTRFAYDMLEDVRKYLMFKNVIILLAAKMEQLFDVIKNNYLLEFDKMKDELAQEIDDRANRYLLKLLPYDRRIYLSNPFEDRFYSFISKNEDEIKIIFKEKNSNEELNEKEITLNEYLNNSYGKIFLVEDKEKEKLRKSLLFPNNLRELIFFILKTEGISENESEIDKIQQFKVFFRHYWIEEKLSSFDKKIIDEFCELDTDKEKNDYIYRELLKKLNLEKKEKNISLGDVRNLINKLREKIEEKKFIFALETMYSIYFKEGRFLEDKNYKLDSEVDRFAKTVNSCNFSKMKRAVLELEKIEPNNNELKKYKEIIEFIDKYILLNKDYKEEKKVSIDLENPERNQKDINFSEILLKIGKRLDINININSEVFTELEDDMREAFEKHREISSKVGKFFMIMLKKIYLEKKEQFKERNILKQVSFEKKKLQALFRENIEKESFKKILSKIKELDKKEESLTFREYRDRLIEESFKRNAFTYRDLFNEILILIDNESKNEETRSALNYFLRGSFESEVEKEKKFLGVMGGYHIYSYLCEKERKIMNSISLTENMDIEKELYRTKNQEEVEKLGQKEEIREILRIGEVYGIVDNYRKEIQIKYIKEKLKELIKVLNEKEQLNKKELLKELKEKLIEKLENLKEEKELKERLIEKLKEELNEKLKEELNEKAESLIEELRKIEQEEEDNKFANTVVNRHILEKSKYYLEKMEENEELNYKLKINVMLNFIYDMLNKLKKLEIILNNKHNLFKVIINHLDENGNLKELFHLNECDENEVFYEKEVKEIDRISKEVWIKQVVDING